MHIYTIPILTDNYAYVIVTDDDTVAVIDPGRAIQIQEFLKKKKLRADYILVTHHHGDHTAGIADLKFEYNAKVLGPAAEADRIPDMDEGLNKKSDFTLGNEAVHIIETPGHTLGQINFYFPQQKALFSGDTLFTLGCGRVFEGSMEQMYNAVQQLAELPDDTRIYGGHEYTLSNIDFINTLNLDIDGWHEYAQRMKDKLAKNLPTVPALLEEEKHFNPFIVARDFAEFKQFREAKDLF